MESLLTRFLPIEQPIKRVFLWGMPGSGKSTLGRKLASKLNWEFVDLDELIVEHAGKSIPEIFEESGESGFREMESEVLATVLGNVFAVISTGGGAPCFLNNAEKMNASGLSVLLDVPMGMLAHRLSHAKEVRPLVSGTDKEELLQKLETMYADRASAYNKAHLIFNLTKTDNKQILTTLSDLIPGKSSV